MEPVSGSGASSVGEIFEDGRRAWPDVALERDVFEHYVEERAPGVERSVLRAPDLYLACACAQGNSRALAHFEKRYLSEVPSFLARTNATARFVDDVRQQLRERLFVEGKIRQFSGRGPLASWLRVVTVRVASNMRARDKRHVELDDAIPGVAMSPELGVMQRRYGDTFRAALREALAGLNPEDRTLLRLHYLEGLNIGSIAVVFRVSRATIGRRVLALRQRIMEDVKSTLRRRLKATSTELESLLRAVRSDLAMSLSVVLREP
jgi:RNA polymerase sigma-70 factor (ECF subfamily)